MRFGNKWISYIYLTLSILGGVLPTIANIRFVKLYGPGFDLSSFISLSSNNPASQSLSYDLLILACSILLWMFIESKRLGIANFWIIILSTFAIAIAFSAPLFLFFRERKLIELKSKDDQNI